MLKPAQLYTNELKKKFWEIAFEDKYMFVNDGYSEDYQPSNNTWNEHEFVSISDIGELLGYIRYNVNQRSEVVSGLCAINFSNSIIYARDLFKAIDDVFRKYKYRKLKFGVFIGNPVEKTYDKLINKYGGRIIGISKADAKLLDGEWHDYKYYEIFREDYLKVRGSRIKA
ncbi:hypothetical protein [Defluviitalea saccharophila]|uniref:Uncharacterized protein n=1 Tax=Defluviitalea saccharophila TaxID=879970 RepID=A0ABZ2Y5L6_9FIRM